MKIAGFIVELWHRWRASFLTARADRRFKAATRDYDRALDHQFAAERARSGSGEGDPQSSQPP